MRAHNIHPTVLQLFWPKKDACTLLIEVTELTGMGFSGRLITPYNDSVPVGSILSESATEARLRLAWKSDKAIGVSFDPAEPNARERLYGFLNSTTRVGMGGARAEAKDVLSVLTRAGLLKAERAVSFSNRSKTELFLNRSYSSSRWLFQSFRKEETYLSFARVSDSGWLIQELGFCFVRGCRWRFGYCRRNE